MQKRTLYYLRVCLITSILLYFGIATALFHLRSAQECNIQENDTNSVQTNPNDDDQPSDNWISQLGMFTDSIFLSPEYRIKHGALTTTREGRAKYIPLNFSWPICPRICDEVPTTLEDSVLSLNCPPGRPARYSTDYHNETFSWRNYTGPFRTSSPAVLTSCSDTCDSSQRWTDGRRSYFCMNTDCITTQVIEKESVYKRYEEATKKHNTARAPLHVGIIFVDSISRPNFVLGYPKTFEFLKERTKEGRSTSFAFPFLSRIGSTRMTYHALLGRSKMLQQMKVPPNRGLPDKVKTIPWLWKLFQNRGYVAAHSNEATWVTPLVDFFGEDPWINITTARAHWNYQEELGDHQLLDLFSRPVNGPYKPWHMWGSYDLKKQPTCIGGKKEAELHFNWVEQFISAYKGIPHFFFAHNYNAHLPAPTEQVISYIRLHDESLEQFLQNIQLKEPEFLDNLVLLITSDHGRPELLDIVGNPYAILTVPNWFLEENREAAENLQNNQYQIISFFDLYATIANLLDFPRQQCHRVDGNCINEPGQSLFTHLPNRNCSQLGVEGYKDENICPFKYVDPNQKEPDIQSPTPTQLETAGLYLVQHFNQLLQPYPQCAVTTLDKVLDVAPQRGYFIMDVLVQPDNRVFYATMKMNNSTGNLFSISGFYQYTGWAKNRECFPKDLPLNLEQLCCCLPLTDNKANKV